MNSNVKKLVRASLLLAVAIVFQMIGKANPAISQLLVGSIVNAVLLIAVFMCDTWWATAVGVLTPILAFLTGQLPTPMGPFVPFIAVGNAIYIIIFGLLIHRGKWGKYTGYVIGAILKFLFLSLSVQNLVQLFGIKLPQAASKMMTTPQLITALIGGAAALIIIEIMKSRKVSIS